MSNQEIAPTMQKVVHSPVQKPTTACFVCKMVDNKSLIKCSSCLQHFHEDCIGFKGFIDSDHGKEWICTTCENKPNDSSSVSGEITVPCDSNITTTAKEVTSPPNKPQPLSLINLRLKLLEENHKSKEELHQKWLEDKEKRLQEFHEMQLKILSGEDIEPNLTTPSKTSSPGRLGAELIRELTNDGSPAITDIVSRSNQTSKSNDGSFSDAEDGNLIGIATTSKKHSVQSVANNIRHRSINDSQHPTKIPDSSFQKIDIGDDSSSKMQSMKMESVIPGDAKNSGCQIYRNAQGLLFQMVPIASTVGENRDLMANSQKRQPDVYQSHVMNECECNNCSHLNPMGITPAQRAARKVVSQKLPPFSGKNDDWEFFINTIEQTTEICGITEAENLMRLKECLKGDALQSVSGQLRYPKDVPSAIESLRLIYGDPDLVVESMMKRIRQQPHPKSNDGESMIKFAVSVKGLCSTIRNSNTMDLSYNSLLLPVLVAKLPYNLRFDWTRHQITLPRPVTIYQFEPWIFEIAQATNKLSITMSAVEDFKPTSKSDGGNKRPKEKGYINTHSNVSQGSSDAVSKPIRKCCVCKGDCSEVQSCTKFVDLSYNDKWTAVKENSLCRCCLKKHGRHCKGWKSCGKNGCDIKHHPLLHRTLTATTNPTTSVTSTTTTSEVLTHRANNQHILFRYIPVIIYNDGSQLETFAFIDNGSSLTLVEQEIADQLNIKGKPEALCLKWTGETHRNERESTRISFNMSGTLNPDSKFDIKNARTVKALNLPTQSLSMKELEKMFPHLDGLPIESYHEISPKILIGIDNLNLAIPSKCREGMVGQPVAFKSRIGWSVCGPCNGTTDDGSFSFHICECHHEDNLDQLMKDYFAIEAVDPAKFDSLDSAENTRAKDILEKTTVRRGDKFESGLLWKSDVVNFPDSYPMAERRLKCLVDKMDNNPELATILHKQIEDYARKGYIRELTPKEAQLKDPRTWYLPIFPVLNPNKPGKVRLVWDAASKVKGVSLNSHLLKGPDQLVSLPSVLYKFREKKIAICADIEEMFLRIQIRPEDQTAQRFLWQKPGDKKPSVFVMQAMTFGSTSSPSTAQFVKNKNALEFAEQYPRAVRSITENHYVDDLLDSTDSVGEAIQLAKDIKNIHKAGGFNIRNWISNSSEVINSLGETFVDKKTINSSVEYGTEKVLGLSWCTQSDSFIFKLDSQRVNEDLINGSKIPTKREILRLIMQMFDPLGMLGHFMIYAKIILQQVWLEKLGWDDPLTPELFKKWLLWVKRLKQIEQIQIQRSYTKVLSVSTDDVELHVFVDAGKDAYAAIAFIRIQRGTTVECSMISAKTRVAPLKMLSIPRLELEGAVLGVRLANTIVQSHSIKFTNRYFWSDSKTVLSWIRTDHRQYRQFVAFRVSEIVESTNKKDWRYVPTSENVADDGTKWSKNPDFNSGNRWYVGPDFLYKNKDEWPKDCVSETTTEEQVKSQLHHMQVQSPQVLELQNFSTWGSLRRRMMQIRRFIFNARSRSTGRQRRTGIYCREEYIEAEMAIFKQVQKETYSREVEILESNIGKKLHETRLLPKASEIYSINPYIDDCGVIRIRRRIESCSDASEFTKRPILLPRNHHVTKLVILFYHFKFHHQYDETITNELRQRFHIAKIRPLVKLVVRACQWCKIQKAKPSPPMMADLPPARLKSFERPFSFSGIDFFGPMKVKSGRKQEKRWGMLITCLTTRAIHIEVVHTMSTESCILALRSFMARRGPPVEIFSDCGTNFVGANHALIDANQQIDKNRLMTEFSTPNTRWTFNPPASPHFGGVWERMVQAVKKSLKSMAMTQTPSDEVLKSMLAEVENIINSRPLTYIPLDSEQDEALTPNHFILGSSNGLKPISEYSEEKTVTRSDWLNSQRMLNIFWRRWMVEVMPLITRRSKWIKPAKPIEVGDLVIIVDDQSPRNCWPRGRVIRTVVAKDGQVRRATVRTTTGVYERAAVKLAVLDVGSMEGKPPDPIALPGGSVSNCSTQPTSPV